MSIEVMKQALEVLEQINQLSIGENAIALPGEIDGAMDNLRAAIEQAEKPITWFHADNYKTRFTTDPSEELFGKDWKPLYTVPRQEQYDQTSLELCEECSWKALIPGDGCLICARQKAKPAAWVYPEFWDHLKQVNCGTAYRLPSDGMQPLYTVPAAPKPLRWVDTIIPGDWVIDNDDETQARVSKLVRQRPAAPDYFKLEFDDGSYIDVTDNELIANYKPLSESRKPVAYADERIHGWPDCFVMEPDPPHTTPLYTEPREWVELTDDEARALVNRATFGDRTNWQALVYMIDAKLKEKNAA